MYARMPANVVQKSILYKWHERAIPINKQMSANACFGSNQETEYRTFDNTNKWINRGDYY
jgi:hypothetical protein